MATIATTHGVQVQGTMESKNMVQHSYQEVHVSEQRTERSEKVKKKKSMRRHKDEGTISVSKSSEKLHKKMKASSDMEANPQCEKCSRPVYAMERVKAERRVWHKDCFRCVQCNKQLTVETYESDHTTLFCKPHFRQLFEPKPVEEDEADAAAPKKHQMIICESNPIELPPDVVRASDKPDLGIEELTQLDLKSRFEVFEKGPAKNEPETPPPPRGPREKSQALLSKLAKFKAKGMDIGVSDEDLNGVPIEHSSSEPEDEEDDEDSVLRKSYKQTSSKEQPVSFCNMSEIVGKFESGQQQHATSGRRQERKQEIQNIRTRLFMGKQAKIKEMYEESVKQSEQGITSADKIARELELDAEKARAIKQRFENGEIFNDENQPPRNRDIEDHSLFNEEKARTIKQRFENGEIFNDEKQPPSNREIENNSLFNEEKARTIKQRFENGEIFNDEKQPPSNREIENHSLFNEEKARTIKQRFENGEIFNDEKQPPSNREIENHSLFNEEKARTIKQRFENGEIFKDEKQPPRNSEIEDHSMFNEGIGKKSRSIFLELDANAKNMPPTSPPPQEPPKRKEIPFVPKDVVRAEDKVEDVHIETRDISDRFKFFETYKPETQKREFRMTPPRQVQRPKSPSPEVYLDPNVVRSGPAGAAGAVDAEFAADRHTASRMINVFRQMERNLEKGEEDQGPKPLKRFTPPPPGESNHHGDSSEYSSEEEGDEDSEDERRRLCLEQRQRDEALKQAQQLARTTSFRGRFEKWSESEPQRSPSAVVIERGQPGDDDDGESQLETAKSLREKFENMQVQQSSVTKTFATKVNRFV